MSSTQERRREYNYREEYFKHNKGLFGCIYFCAQCYKPLLRKDVEVDHIISLAKHGPNHRINCVATCRKCNRSKSDKLDERAIKGYLFKLVEEIFIWTGKLFSVALRYVLGEIENCGINIRKLGFYILLVFMIYLCFK